MAAPANKSTAQTDAGAAPLDVTDVRLRFSHQPRPARDDFLTSAQAAVTGYVHSTDAGGTVDGPGVRYVAFLSGCPLRCQYCHNPDTWRPQAGTLTSAGALVEDIAGYRGFIGGQRGGVTLSGGEPLAQAGFAAALLSGCKALGLHTALDTSGFLGHLADDEMLTDVDLVLLDIKGFDEDKVRRLTDAPLAPTLAFARRLAALKKPVWLRYVLVPGLTDDQEEIAALAAFAAGLGNVGRVEVLPFHQMGAHKWEASGRDYALAGVATPEAALLERVRGIFRAHGLDAGDCEG